VGAGADNMAPGDPTTAATAVVRLQMDTLGSCAIASTASYLDHGVVFVGSVLGDSQLVQISDEPIEEDAETLESTYLSVVEEFTNLGPILDLDVMDHGPGLATRQVVTASGSSQSGSLRLIRNGIGMNESAVVEIPGIQAMWSVKGPNGVDDFFLVQSFVTETRVLGVVGEGLEEVELPGLDATCSTLYVGNVGRSSLVVQVTATEVRLIDAEQGTIWDSHAADITVAAGNCCQVAIALRGGRVVLFTVDASEHKLVQQGEKQMDREVSCLDVHPFSAKSTDGSAMDVDDEDDGSGRSSDYLAVGLWDDCTIRMLATSTMQELLCVNLEEDDPDDTAVAPSPRRTRNNMMARSLCMLTLDYSASGSAATGTSGSDGRSAAAPGVEMLFVGLGDGTLVSFAVLSLPGGKLSVRSKKEVCLGTQRIDLVPLHSERGGTCVLATGDRPTVIYLAGVGGSASSHANPKLCYSNVNLSSSEDDAGEENSRLPPHQTIAVNVATPFMSPVLFDTLGSQHYSLCVADDTHLRLGVIDDIQKLHVTTCRLGMAPRRIAHCASGRLFAVGCVESGINHVGLSENEGNMTNCIRFMDETTFDDIERVDLEPFEMLLSLAYVTLKVPLSGKGASDGLRPKESVSPIYKPFLLVGTAFAIPDEDEPTRGRILVYSFQGDDTVGAPSRVVRLVTETACTGGVYSLCQFYDGMILCSVNTKTMLCRLVDETGINRLEYAGTGHHGHILSLCVKSLAKRRETHGGANPSGSVLDDQQKEEAEETPEMLAIVGDLMRSVSLVQFYPEHEALEEIARDFNPNWTTACEMLNDNVYLAAENFHNLFCLRRNHAMSEEFRCRLDTTGEYHLGEQVNKFMSGSLVMPVTSSPTTAEDKHSRRRLNSPQKSASPRTRRAVVEIGSQVLFGTVEGTLGVSLGLDGRTAAFFSSLERAMASVIKPVGNLTHEMYRAVKGQNRTLPAHGFVDGDLVESFLDLDRALMELVVKEMNREGRWEVDEAVISEAKRGSTKRSEEQDEDQTRSELTVDDVLAMVEEMTMLH
jgi:DNA damage-binding protein 1